LRGGCNTRRHDGTCHVPVTCVMSHSSRLERGHDVLGIDVLCDITLTLERTHPCKFANGVLQCVLKCFHGIMSFRVPFMACFLFCIKESLHFIAETEKRLQFGAIKEPKVGEQEDSVDGLDDVPTGLSERSIECAFAYPPSTGSLTSICRGWLACGPQDIDNQ
jgi:hypothetical protein